jgi:hypothetical protein
MSTPELAPHRRQQGGPPLGVRAPGATIALAGGLLFAAIAELSTLSIATDKLAVLLPIARFPILIWLIVAGFQLPRTRQRQNR